MPLFWVMRSLSLGAIRRSLMVLPPLKNTWMPYFLQVFLTLSPRPLMYGTVMYVLLLGWLLLPLSPLFLLLDCLCAMVFFYALFKAHFGYLHTVRACLMWSCSFTRCCLVEQTSFALWNKVLMTLYFADMAWWLSHWRYCPVWVGFLYTVVDNDPSGWGMTKTSKKGSVPSAYVSSAVNCIESSIEFIWWKNSSWWHFLMTKNVSSTNLFHRVGGLGAVLRA